MMSKGMIFTPTSCAPLWCGVRRIKAISHLLGRGNVAFILIADDDELVVELVRNALSCNGHFVGAVDDGKRVVSIVTARRPDLVILDCSMPEVSGIDALIQMRLSRDCYQTPVLMLTSHASQVSEDIAIRAGAQDYLRKPFDPDELSSRVEILLNRAAKQKLFAEKTRHFVPPIVPTERRWGQR